MARTSIKPLRKKVVGRSLRSPLAGTWLRVWHFGHLMASPPPHVSYHPVKHFKQKLCRQERCLGSVNKSEHTEQDTSSRRLWNKVVRSMMSSTTSELWPLKQFTLNNEVLWLSMFSVSRNLKREWTNQRASLWEGCYLLLFSLWFMIPRNDLPRGKICVIKCVNWMVFQI